MTMSSSERTKRVITVIQLLRKAVKGMQEPAATILISEYGKDPFLILVSCILSLRTKDSVSLPASQRLFTQAKTPQQLLQLPDSQIQQLIYPVGFYRNKSKTLKAISHVLITDFNGMVPATLEGLLSLPGVGQKTANLVLGEAFGIPAICVDTHVHKISNRLGLVTTTTPEETEVELKKILPEEYWIEYNRLLVMWGQNICVPVSPWCSRCVLSDICPKKGVTRRR